MKLKARVRGGATFRQILGGLGSITSERGGRGDSSTEYAFVEKMRAGTGRSTNIGMTGAAVEVGFGGGRRGESIVSPRHSGCSHTCTHTHASHAARLRALLSLPNGER